ncbi:Bestrophin, RFP-TM, chloride channel [compost metagenome]
MIVRPKPNLINVLIALKGSIAKRIALRSLMVTLMAYAIVLVETMHPSYFAKVAATPFTLLGLSLWAWMPLAMSWKTRSAMMKMTCPSMPSCATSSAKCFGRWWRQICRPGLYRSTTCWADRP